MNTQGGIIGTDDVALNFAKKIHQEADAPIKP